ncbi:MAG: maltose ABC transporter substrate-binding protein [Lachnospiraceae bacterium]|nr:maltose ABC transporter substrate-binding protein [Lachnospiraceae bacterium]
MGIMKRKIMAMALATTMAASMLVGCGGGGSDVEAVTTKAPSADGEASIGGVVEGYESYTKRTDLTQDEIKLTIWESQDGPDEFVKQAGEKFSEIYPNIKIEYVNVESTSAKDQIANDGPAGLGPDLFAAANDCTGTMASTGSIQPLEEINSTYADAVKKMPEICVSGVSYDSKTWGFPVARETYTVFYNKDLIDSVPTTWEELVTVAKDFNSKNEGKYALMWQAGNTYHSVFFLTSDTIKLFGPTLDDYANGTGFNNETSIAGAKFFQSLRKDILDVDAGNLDEATTVAYFEEGKCAMVIDGSWKIGAYEEAIPNLGAATLPSLPGQSQPASNFAGIRTMYVSAYSDYKNEAAAFGEFMMCKEMQQLRYELTKTIPSRDDVEIDDEVMKVFLEQLKYSFAMPPVPQIAQYWTCFNSVYTNMWNGEDCESQISEADEIFKTFTAQ